MTRRPDDAAAAESRRALVVVAAGSGTRLGHGIPKAAVTITDRSILEHSLDAVTDELNLDLVVLVLPSDPQFFEQLSAQGSGLASRTGTDVVLTTGGSSRPASVKAGLGMIAEYGQPRGWAPEHTAVLIHDAARALTPTEVHQRVAQAVEAGAEAVVPAVAVADTIKEVQTPAEITEKNDDVVVERVAKTLPRSDLRAVQTPQGFTWSFLDRAFEHIKEIDDDAAARLTDEAMIAEALDVDVVVVPGHPHALKITTETDLITARGLLDSAGAAQKTPEVTIEAPRVGIGHDIHAFAPEGEPIELWLAGLHWPGQQGLAGHSDGDAVAHAACAALFSAAGMGDLGTHFGADTIGTSRPELQGAHGTVLLAEAARIVREAGFSISSISVQFIGARPKFAPRREEAQKVLSEAAGAPVSVGATTSDGLGFAGRREGIMATATAVLLPVSG
ncbi:2-C-methyl-D-erythritol 2,4-cyclodiphosphate synthase [Nesterenkonia sp. MY13]|uniref:2-C-methyl-D-erythritol 2,4-cyclodiphosphate synthase n=1 Tax=Nesterenkonia sedimenti TaxID=1463632 RepID=A0A7X8YER8_9MICC|nr:2-C-methyl-D-erythritol 2,4-cyclodiphosphate synthase [Nesterenkonia sedimenti]NLS10884.1 2-C-methyl-D-erythritol 2,4-cyclodiphosphate synthase [Nesterenkonia sedimenti]